MIYNIQTPKISTYYQTVKVIRVTKPRDQVNLRIIQKTRKITHTPTQIITKITHEGAIFSRAKQLMKLKVISTKTIFPKLPVCA